MPSPKLKPAPERPSGAVAEPATAPEPAAGAGAAALDGPATSTTLRVLNYLDLIALAVALPVFIVGRFPLAGYGVAAGAWVFQRVARDLLARRAAATTDVRTAVGLNAASMLLRGWLVAFAIFAVGLRDAHAGLAAAVLFLFLFSIFFTMQAILRPSGRPAPPRRAAP